MKEKRDEQIRLGQYLSANEYQDQINLILKSSIENNKQINYDNHQRELDNLEREFENDMKEVSSYYEDKLNSFLEEAKKKEVYLFETHRQEVEDYITKLDNSLSKVIKYSKKYLDIKQKELAAAKSENFIQANYFKRQCDLMEKEEIARFTNERNKKIESKVNILKEKQNKEKKSLKQKLDREYEELQAERRHRIDVSVQNYKNKKRNIQNDYNKTQSFLNNKSKMSIN